MSSLPSENKQSMYLLVCYVPNTSLEQVKQALFAAGAGRLGNYEQCCWQTQGQGQFCALDGAKPTIGDIGTVETVAESKLELLCNAGVLAAVQSALIKAHPYETPAYHLLPIIAPMILAAK